MKYVANRNTRVIHEVDDKGRSKESCNLDEARRVGNLRAADANRFDALYALGYRNCTRCMSPSVTGRAPFTPTPFGVHPGPDPTPASAPKPDIPLRDMPIPIEG